MEVNGNTGAWAWKKPDGSLVPLRGDVRFDHVVFGYDDRKIILHDISLFAKPGQKIAFVGSTGAGKTTITSLINRFYEIQSGTITYDGIDVRDIQKDSLRRSLGVVLQDTWTPPTRRWRPRPGWRERTASSATCLTVIKRSSPARAAASVRASGSF